MRSFPILRNSLALAILAVASAASAQLTNGSFELGTGSDATGWGRFGNAYVQDANVRTGTRSAKLFGNFDGNFNVTGIFQDFAYVPGTTGVTASIYGYNPSNDAVNPANTALLKLIYRDSGDNDLLASEVNLDTATAKQDSWQLLTARLGAAPANTAKVSVFLLYLQPAFGGGAAFFDDASVNVSAVPEPTTFAALGLGAVALLRRRRR